MGEGFWRLPKGKIILLGARRREVRSLLQLPVYPQGTYPVTGMRQAVPWCPHISHWFSALPSSMDPGHGLWVSQDLPEDAH